MLPHLIGSYAGICWHMLAALMGRPVKELAEEKAANNEVKILTKFKQHAHPPLFIADFPGILDDGHA